MQYKTGLQNHNRWPFWLAYLLLAIGMTGVVFVARQDSFLSIIFFVILAYLSFGWLLRQTWQDNQTKTALWIGLGIRLLLLFSFPNLSDDIYRFFWDGALILEGVNPYGILPSEAINLSPVHDQRLFEHLNSKDYFTIYPPVSQLFYAIGSVAGSEANCAIILRILFILIEAIAMFFAYSLLLHFNQPCWRLLIYYLCPLVIIEGIGNLHFEIIMMAFLVIGIYYLVKSRYLISALWFALSIGIKLLPLMILPYLWFYLKGKSRLVFFLTLMICLSLIFVPLLSSMAIFSMLDSVDLYFRKFEFNASIYFILRWIGDVFAGYNLIGYIGPGLAMIIFTINIYWAKTLSRSNSFNFFKYASISWTAYLLLATTVHPWYLIPLVVIAIYEKITFALVWSGLIFFSYAHYDAYFKNFENVFLIVEYIVVLLLFYHNRKTMIA